MPSDPRIVYSGSFSGSTSARSFRAQVRLLDTGLEITLPDRAGTERWPYDSLTSSAPLKKTLPVIAGSTLAPDARLHVPDPAFARRLAERAPHLSARAHRRRVLWPMLLASAVIVLLAVLLWRADYSPSRSLAGLIPPPAWSRLGENVLAHLVKSRKTCTAPAGTAALNRLAMKLAGDNAATYSLHVAKLGVVNAFALPGRHIVISARLIDKSASADEVAGVLAHEIGHGIERHPETGLVRSLGISMAATLLFGGASTEKIGAMAGFLIRMRYSRKAEMQADNHAINLLRAAHISTRPLADFFERIVKKRKDKAEPGSFLNALRSHPATQARISALRAVRIKGAKPALGKADWQALRAICAGGKG